MLITLINDFHSTAANVRTADGWLSKGQVKRIRRTLCGIDGCTCGGELGERGAQDYAVVDIDTRPNAPHPVRVGCYEDRI